MKNVTVRAPVRIAVAAFLLAVPSALAVCGGGPAHPTTSAPPTRLSPSRSVTGGLISSSTPPPVAVSDVGGSRFEVSASPVVASIVVAVNSFQWSAAPGQEFLVDNLTVKNPTAGVETLSDFDDLTSGLADDVAFVMSAADARPLGYSSDCGIDPAYPSSLCTISFGQGLTVESDSIDQANRSAVELPPGSTAQIAVSYGPVSDSVMAAKVSVYFDGGVPVPADLTP